MSKWSRWFAFAAGVAVAAVFVTRGSRRLSRAAEAARDAVDEASDESFPASDPPAHTPVTGSQPTQTASLPH